MASYKLIYFNAKGLGELIRYVFAVAGQDFEDYRIEFADWPKYKNETVFGQLPILVIKENDKEIKLAQSGSIARFLARKFGLAGKDEVHQAKVESVLDYFSDLQPHFRSFFRETDPVLKAEKLKQFQEVLPEHLTVVEKLLETRNNPYLLGDELTVADLSLAATLDRFESFLGNNLEKFPHIKAINERINSNPRLAAYKAKRPVTPF